MGPKLSGVLRIFSLHGGSGPVFSSVRKLSAEDWPEVERKTVPADLLKMAFGGTKTAVHGRSMMNILVFEVQCDIRLGIFSIKRS